MRPQSRNNQKMSTSFDFLSLRLEIDCQQPVDYDWIRLWSDPGAVDWDWNFHRPLIHETFHFWQLLCSPYLARLISTERTRLEAFESFGAIPPPNDYRERFTAVDPELGFSAEQLLESWARFWEIQVQTPLYLLQQESIRAEDVQEGIWKIADPESPFYKKWYWAHIEIAMTRGANCRLYGRPFRWFHEQVCKAAGINPTGPDDLNATAFRPVYLACVCYPLLVYNCFLGDDPVAHFKQSVSRICNHDGVMAVFCSDLNAQFYELEWFQHWELLRDAIPAPTRLPQVDGELWNVFRAPEADFLKIGEMFFDMLEEDDALWDPSLPEARALLRTHGSEIAFAHMGHRPFRMLLATLSSPPLMYFQGEEGFVQHSHRAEEVDINRLDDSILGAIAMRDRTDRFKRAQKAHELGLPLNAFDPPA